MWTAVISFLTGVSAGLLVNALWVRRWRMRSTLERFRKPKYDVLDFEPADVGLFPINRWSPARPLRRDRIRMTVASSRPGQGWCDPVSWSSLAEKFKAEGKTGDIGYLVDFQVDHHETMDGQLFRYSVSHCDYWEHLATVEYLQHDAAARSKIWEAFENGHILDFARSAPPAAIKINVALLSPDRKFIAIQRSGSVDHKKGAWTVGPNETMILRPFRTPGSQMEDLFGVAERCIREEIGLEPVDYGPINISWMGYDAASAQAKVYAQVKTHLPRREVDRRMSGSHGLWEAQAVEWIPLNKANALDIMENWERGDSHGRRWSASAPHALQELWRFRALLELRELD